MIHVFHGFLGSPADFSFLKGPNVILHDLYEPLDIQIASDDVLIGYSMGGRVALELAASVNFNIKKLILIGSHPGLATDEERKDREAFENLVMEKLGSSKDEFLGWWNSLPVFFHDLPLTINEPKRFEQARALFERMKLSKQKNYLPTLIQHREKILWVIGLFDEKYMDLALEVLQPMDLEFVTVPGGHRLFQNAEGLKKLLEVNL